MAEGMSLDATEVYERWHRYVYQTIRNLWRDRPDDWDDIAQDVWVKVLASLPTRTAIGPAWFSTITRYVVIDRYRKSKKHPTLELMEHVATTFSAEDYFIDPKILSAIKRLPDRARKAVLLSIAGYKPDEVPGKSGTHRVNLHRGRKAIKAAISA